MSRTHLRKVSGDPLQPDVGPQCKTLSSHYQPLKLTSNPNNVTCRRCMSAIAAANTKAEGGGK